MGFRISEGDQTRRELLRNSLVVGAAVGTGGFGLIGCGDGSNKPAATAAASSGKGKAGGTLRIALIASSADTVDAHIGSAGGTGSLMYSQAIYDGLVRMDHKFQPQLALAEELTPANDLKSWTVRLRDGLEFHNGKTVTADDVIFSIQRILDPRNGASGAKLLASIDPNRMKKLDERTVRLNLRYPDVSLEGAFGKFVNGIVPTDYDPRKPVGTGPYKLVSFSPQQKVVFERFPNWYQDGRPYLDRLEFIAFTDPTALMNALTSGAADAAGNLGPQQFELARQNGQLNTVQSATGSFDTFTMRTDRGPFKDVRVRQAMKYLMDREQMIQQVYAGFGRIGNDLGAPQDKLYASAIPQHEHDPEKARSLLKAAGAENLSAEMVIRTDSTYYRASAEVFSQQAKEFGLNFPIRVINDAGTFYTKYYGQVDFSQDWYLTNTLWTVVGFGLLKGAPYNTTHWSNDKATNLFLEARGTLDEAKRKELAVAAQQIVWEDSGWLLWGFQDTLNAMSKKFTGMVEDLGGNGINGGRFDEISAV